jgi:N-sulfoglucosamine sulfohydrolase
MPHLYYTCLRVFIFVTLLGYGLFAAEKSPAPNIILITADDLGYDSLGCMGNPLKGLSPHLDQFAKEATIYENCFITTPICGPSRNSLYTGTHPTTNGYMGHGVQPPTWWRKKGKSFPKTSITTSLRDHGYLTGIVGKHGSSVCKFDMQWGSLEQTGFGRDPSKYADFVRQFLEKAKRNNKPFFLTANTHDPHHYWARDRGETKRWFDAGMGKSDWKAYPNGKPYPDPLTQFKPEDCPVPAAYPNDDDLKKRLSKYYDSVNRMDQVVGEILSALKDSGMEDNTVVMFLSDHGLPLEMSKWSLYPSGARTPLIVRWPGQVKAGGRDKSSVISAVDIAPTLASIAKIPSLPRSDGMSFEMLLKGQASQWTRKEAFSCFNYMNNLKPANELISEYSPLIHQKVEQYRPSRALNNTQFCYIWNGWSDGEAKLPRTMGGSVTKMLKKNAKAQQDTRYPNYAEKAKFLRFKVSEELYDIRKDPGCRNNLAKDPEMAVELKNFRSRMLKLMHKTDDHEKENYMAQVLP